MNDANAKALDDVLALLALEQVADDRFRGQSRRHRLMRVYGGQVLGQALMAASRTVAASFFCHSLHAYFLKAGDPRAPIDYEVRRVRDGRSFSARSVTAIQEGGTIFLLMASFQGREAGFAHQSAMPVVPPPEELADERQARLAEADLLPAAYRDWATRPRPFETRPVILDPLGDRPARPAFEHIWFRAAGPVPDQVATMQALLAYASDMSLVRTALLPHGKGVLSAVQIASLDHAMWFHRPFRFDDWMLYAQDSPAAFGARGFSRGAIFTRDGVLVASVAQEGLIRPRPA